MKITHILNNKSVNNNVCCSSFLLTNKKGSYCFFGKQSRYNGIFFYYKGQMYKVIDSLIVSPKITHLQNKFGSVELRSKDLAQNFLMHDNSLICELSHEHIIELVLDIRKSYSMPQFGRFYSITNENNKVVIRYEEEGSFSCYLVLNSPDFEITDNWFEKKYPDDEKRNSFPYSSYVYSALKVRTNKLILTFSFDKEKAIKENNYVINNLSKLKNVKTKFNRKGNGQIAMAYSCCQNSLNGLMVSNTGIFAGLPWFFQFWARDEAISLNSAIDMKQIKLILGRLLSEITPCKNPVNYINGSTSSADAFGWILKRAYEFDKQLFRKNLKNLILIKENSDLIVNNPGETWMDSLDRSGIRIEIQALYLNILRCIFNLTKDQKIKRLEERYKLKVKSNFWNNQYLIDGVSDITIRPNIFIAAYVYPDLLSRLEWIRCFETILPRLWLNWGGLSTIDKKSPLFCSKHTGEDPKSYHNGDSWFFVNNMAALVMHRIDKRRFNKYINKIMQASTKEILWMGAVGHHAELSSAERLSSKGSPMQAWSAAMYIELVNELENN
ncbi:MAG: amylo-alpha-1,6-glucosidase [Nanoarchaeota archaeon]